MLSLALLSLLLSESAVGAEVHMIGSASDFTGFVDSVNGGTNYKGTTVLLDADISLSGIPVKPIGGTLSGAFKGSFNGQGHVISGLEVDTDTFNYVGLFGYTDGLTVRNLILDSTCSVAVSHTSGHFYIGGILGYLNGGPCVIENTINMASVSFSGDTNDCDLFLGGIIGYIRSSSSSRGTYILKNCANYGSITQTGTSANTYIGGIVGYFSGSGSHAQNCLNNGELIFNGTTKNTLNIGGFAGYTYDTQIKNCVSAGKANLLATAPAQYIGGFVGNNYMITSLYHCYWINNEVANQVYGTGNAPTLDNVAMYDSSSFELNQTVSVYNYTGTSLIDALNAFASKDYEYNNFSNWILNVEEKNVTFILNNVKMPIKLSSQIILLPDLADDEAKSFDGWYTDPYCTTLLQADGIYENSTLYGLYGVVVSIEFNVDEGGSMAPGSKRVAVNGRYGEFPTPSREGYSFAGWFTEKNESVTSETIVSVPSDHTLYANWTSNKYIVTLDVNGGNELTEREVTVTFDSTYGVLPTPTREGYIFAGWFTEKNESVTNKTIVTIPSDHTLYAHWEEEQQQQQQESQSETPSDYVEIIFSTKDLSEEDIKEIVRQFTDETFEIIKIDTTAEGELRAIIKFVDVEKAVEFVRNVRTLTNSYKSLIRWVGFISQDKISLFPVLCPSLFRFFMY